MQGPERLNDRVSSVEVGLMSLLDIGVLVVLAMIPHPALGPRGRERVLGQAGVTE